MASTAKKTFEVLWAFNNDGSVNEELTMLNAKEAIAGGMASMAVNWDELYPAVIEFFLRNKGLRSCPSERLVNRLYEKRLATDLADASDEVRDAARARIKEVLPFFLKDNPDMFFQGRKTGIAIRYVPGELDAKGEQIVRWSDSDWAQLIKPKGKNAEKSENDSPDSSPASSK